MLFLMCIGALVLFVCFGEVRPWLCGLDDFLLAYEIAALTHIKQRDGNSIEHTYSMIKTYIDVILNRLDCAIAK